MSILTFKPEPRFRKHQSKIAGLTIIVVAVTLLLFKTTFASNISLNNSQSLEYGQGVSQTVACSGANQITMTPSDIFTNASNAGSFTFNALTVSGIPTGCYGSDFTINAFNNSDSAQLALYSGSATGVVVYDYNGTFYGPSTQTGLTISTNSTSSFTVTFASPVADAQNIYKLTIQSGANVVTLSCKLTNTPCTWTDLTASGALHNLQWMRVATNASGSVIAAAIGNGTLGDIYLSRDYGATWTDATSTGVAHNHNWYGITISADGTHISAVDDNYGDVYTSTNSGSTWTDDTPSGIGHNLPWWTIASNTDGTRLAAAVNGGDIYISSDSGSTWSDVTPSGVCHSQSFTSIASSSDGTRLAAAVSVNFVCLSSNSGASWNRISLSMGGTQPSIASSSDGTHLIISSYRGDLLTSSDSGVTWSNKTTSTSLSGLTWNSVASNADGTQLAAVVCNGDIYTSANSGTTWIDQTPTGSTHNISWFWVASSSDGSHLAALALGGDIYSTSR